VLSVVADPALVSLPDDQILARATTAKRALVTTNIKDFMPLDAEYRAERTRPRRADPDLDQGIPSEPRLHRSHHQRAPCLAGPD
jgi:hypothetical protein